MLKRIAFLFALLLMPSAVMAQNQPQEKKHDHAAAASEHKSFPQLIIQKRADLNLTDEQVAKLEAISVKMAAHHKAMAEHHDNMAEHHQQMKAKQAEKAEMKAEMKADKAEMKHDAMQHNAMSEEQLHDEFFAIFTPDQLAKVKPLMKEHMDALCASEGEGGEHCKMMEKKKKAE
jgi:hypothetical protein